MAFQSLESRRPRRRLRLVVLVVAIEHEEHPDVRKAIQLLEVLFLHARLEHDAAACGRRRDTLAGSAEETLERRLESGHARDLEGLAHVGALL